MARLMFSNHYSPLHSCRQRTYGYRVRCIPTALLQRALLLLLFFLAVAASAQPHPVTIGGEPVVTIRRPLKDKAQPQFLELTEMPGRGMAWLQLKAWLPGKGEINLLYAPPLNEAKQLLDNKDDEWGNEVFKIGGAILLPYANRIRGTLRPDGKTINALVDGRLLQLPANWHGEKPGAKRHAIHGLILRSKFQDVKRTTKPDEITVGAVLHAGNFGGHWLSDTDVTVESTLRDNAVELTVTAKNVGKDPLPMGIGWHPYFVIPSGDRKQARLILPSYTRAVMNNYDDTFTTGQRISVQKTPYDFDAPRGNVLGNQYLDDNYSALERTPDGSTVTELIDPKAHYGLRLTTISADIRTIQVYAPTDKNFVAIEPMFNFPDPYNRNWGTLNTGMVVLRPGQSAEWKVRLELFIPKDQSH